METRAAHRLGTLLSTVTNAVGTAVVYGRCYCDYKATEVFCSTLAELQARQGIYLRVCYEDGQVLVRCEATGACVAVGNGLCPSATRFFATLAGTPDVATSFEDGGVRVTSYARHICIFATYKAITFDFNI
jgi:hypothetical protein